MTLKQKFKKMFEDCALGIAAITTLAAPVWMFSLLTVDIIGDIFKTNAFDAYLTASFCIYLFIIVAIFLIAIIETVYETIKNRWLKKSVNELV